MTTKCLSTVQIMCGINTVDVQKSQLLLKKKGKDEKKKKQKKGTFDIFHSAVTYCPLMMKLCTVRVFFLQISLV